MLQRRRCSKPLIILLSSILFSCASPPDVPVCKEINPDKGWCSHTLTQGGFYVDEARPYAFDPDQPAKLWTWWEVRPVMIQVPPHSWAEIKKFIIKMCKLKKGGCPGNVGEWMDKMVPASTTQKVVPPYADGAP